MYYYAIDTDIVFDYEDFFNWLNIGEGATEAMENIRRSLYEKVEEELPADEKDNFFTVRCDSFRHPDTASISFNIKIFISLQYRIYSFENFIEEIITKTFKENWETEVLDDEYWQDTIIKGYTPIDEDIPHICEIVFEKFDKI